MGKAQFRVGDWVEVRSKDEILYTLDRNGRLDGMPFMPEMLNFCGKRFQVRKRAHKTCDTVFPTRSRRIERTVHLPTRCDGSAHGGCEAACLLFWKEDWLRPVGKSPGVSSESMGDGTGGADLPTSSTKRFECSEEALLRSARTGDADSETEYICQATLLPYATKELSPYDVRQYIEDYTSGNVGMAQWLRGFAFATYRKVMKMGIGIGKPMRWLYDSFQRLRGGIPYPAYSGTVPAGQKTPDRALNLREKELVRVRSYREILATCDSENKNRGLYFDKEMVPYCGGVYRVQKRVSRIVDERTGRLIEMRYPCIILEDVFCRGWYSECRMFCPRELYPYWREIWLERVEQ